MKKILILMLLVSGCATTQDPVIAAGKSLLATQQTILATHEAFRAPCKAGTVPAKVCKDVDRIVMEAAPAYDAAVNALIASGSSDYVAKKAAFEALAVNLTALAIAYSVEVAR